MAQNRPETGHPFIKDDLVDDLRHALRHLYDIDELRKNIFLRLLPVGTKDQPFSLQKILIDAIEATRPDSSRSPQSNAWRTYHLLSSRYIQQFHQDEVAKGMGLSLRQIRRLDNLAVRTLLEYLWNDYLIEQTAQNLFAEEKQVTKFSEISDPQDELVWLEKSVETETIPVSDLVYALVKTIEPLTRSQQVKVEVALPTVLPKINVPITAIRQALLTLITPLMDWVAGGAIRIEGESRNDQVQIKVIPVPGKISQNAEDAPGVNLAESIEVARRLAAFGHGSIEIVQPEAQRYPQQIVLILPTDQRLSVFIVDDNENILLLYQRYLASSRYALVGTRNPEQALNLAERELPQAFILDVMMPGLDGWELLGRIREHPKFEKVPIIVSTVLPQEQLALALGAAAFLRKPVSRELLLQTLDSLLLPQFQKSG